MFTSQPRGRRTIAVLATPVAILAAGAMIWQASYAAFTSETRNSGNNWQAGQVALSDDDAGSARFQATNIYPGETETKCIAVTANTSVEGLVKAYTLNPQTSQSGLEDHILITAESGTGGGFGSCTGFTADTTLVTDMSLTDLALVNSYATGIGGWTTTPGTSTRTYRFTWVFDATGLTQPQLDQFQGEQTGIDIEWEIQSS